MSRSLEKINGANWKEFTGSELAVLVLGRSDCEKCATWDEELGSFLASGEEFPEVRFGKMLLDQRGLIEFKRANPWIARIDVLPFNVIYRQGAVLKSYAGGGLERLLNRLRRATTSEGTAG